MNIRPLDCCRPFYTRQGAEGTRRTVGCVEVDTPFGVALVWLVSHDAPSRELAQAMLQHQWVLESAGHSSGAEWEDLTPQGVTLQPKVVNNLGHWENAPARQAWSLSGSELTPSYQK